MNAGLCTLHLPFRHRDELVEDPGLLGVVATMTTPVMWSSLEHRELVAERTQVLHISIFVGLSDGFANLTIEPRIELAVRDRLRTSVIARACPFPTLRDAPDFDQIALGVEIGWP